MLAFSSCEGFLDKFPETSLSPETFYTSEKELELATNGFYTMLPSPDNTTDGALQDNDLEYHISLSSLQMGNRSAETNLGVQHMVQSEGIELLSRTFGELHERGHPQEIRRRRLFLQGNVLL